MLYHLGMNVKEEIDKLTAELKIYQDKYYKEGVSLISDNEYDRLTDRLIELETEHPELQHPDSPTKRVGSDLTNDFPEVRHTIQSTRKAERCPLPRRRKSTVFPWSSITRKEYSREL